MVPELLIAVVCAILVAVAWIVSRQNTALKQELQTLQERGESMQRLVAGARCILWDAYVRETPGGDFDWQFQTFGSDSVRRGLGLSGRHAADDVRAWVKRIPPEDLKKMDETAKRALRERAGGYAQDFKYPDATGNFRHFHEDVQITPAGRGKWHLIGVQVDVTEIKTAQNEAMRQTRYLNTLMQHIPDHVYFKDKDGRFVFVNTAVVQHMGAKTPEEVIGKSDLDFQSGDIAAIYRMDEQKILASGEALINKLEGKPGEWLLISKVPIYDSAGNALGVVGINRNITAVKDAQEALAAVNGRLEKLVREDSLTGLLNRHTLLNYLDKEWSVWLRYGNRFSVMMIDADDFKAINDNHGHLIGDKVLKMLADAMTRSVRNVDLAGRYGGEEFLVVLPQTEAVGAAIAAQNLLQSVRKSSVVLEDGTILKITVSIGITAVTREDRDIEAVLNRADKALYAAKRNGKNRVEADDADGARMVSGTEQEMTTE